MDQGIGLNLRILAVHMCFCVLMSGLLLFLYWALTDTTLHRQLEPSFNFAVTVHSFSVPFSAEAIPFWGTFGVFILEVVLFAPLAICIRFMPTPPSSESSENPDTSTGIADDEEPDGRLIALDDGPEGRLIALVAQAEPPHR